MRAASEFNVLLRLHTGIAKAPYVAEFVRLIVEAGEPVVLFGWHHEVYEIWKERFADLKPAWYTGRESEAQKNANKQRFVKGETDLLIMSLRSGPGIDGLQHRCRTVVIGELDWSPQVIKQDIGRIHRDGQTEPVTAYVMVSDSGSDPTLADTCLVKAQQSDGITDPDAELFEEVLPHDHIKELARAILAQHHGLPSAYAGRP